MQIFFKKPFILQRSEGKGKTKISLEIHVFPQKICGYVGWNFGDNSKNFSKISQEHPHWAPKKISQNWLCENYCFCSKFIWTGDVHFWQPCQFLSPNVKKIAGQTPKSILQICIFLRKTIFVAKLLWAYKMLLWRPLLSNVSLSSEMFLLNSENMHEKNNL